MSFQNEWDVCGSGGRAVSQLSEGWWFDPRSVQSTCGSDLQHDTGLPILRLRCLSACVNSFIVAHIICIIFILTYYQRWLSHFRKHLHSGLGLGLDIEKLHFVVT